MKKCVILLSLLSSYVAYSQSDSINYSIAAGAQISDGNIKNNSFNGIAELKVLHKKNDWSFNPSYKYLISYPYPITPTSKPSRQNEFYMNSHLSHHVDSFWRILFFSELEHSQLRKIDIRFNLGIGPSYRLIKTDHIFLELSGVILPDLYRSMAITNSLPERNNFCIRTSLRAKFVAKYQNITFTTIQMFQPPIKTWTSREDYAIVGWSDNTNFRSSNTIDIYILKGLSFGVSFDYIYQSYLSFIAKDPNVENTGIYLSPSDMTLAFYIKYRK